MRELGPANYRVTRERFMGSVVTHRSGEGLASSTLHERNIAFLTSYLHFIFFLRVLRAFPAQSIFHNGRRCVCVHLWRASMQRPATSSVPRRPADRRSREVRDVRSEGVYCGISSEDGPRVNPPWLGSRSGSCTGLRTDTPASSPGSRVTGR